MHNFKIHHKIHSKENSKPEFSSEMLEKVHKIIARYPEGRQKSALLPVLHMAQEEFGGWLSADTMDYVAELLQIEPIEVYEVATFYSQFYTEKTGKYVLEVCQTGTCAACGGEDIMNYLQQKLGIKNDETTPDGLFTLKGVECLGGCGYAPVMQVNTEFEEQLTEERIDEIISALKNNTNAEKAKESKWAEKFF